MCCVDRLKPQPKAAIHEMLEKSINLKIKYLIAVGIGLVFGWIQLRFWAIYPINNPITDWLLETFAKQGQSGLIRLFTYAHDLVVHFILALVLAIVLVRVFGRRQWAAIFTVVAASHVAMFWDAVWENMDIVIQFWGFWISLITTLSVVPFAYLLAGEIKQLPSSD